jgi:hypothetical protein
LTSESKSVILLAKENTMQRGSTLSQEVKDKMRDAKLALFAKRRGKNGKIRWSKESRENRSKAQKARQDRIRAEKAAKLLEDSDKCDKCENCENCENCGEKLKDSDTRLD